MIECIKEAEYKKSINYNIYNQPQNYVVVSTDMLMKFSKNLGYYGGLSKFDGTQKVNHSCEEQYCVISADEIIEFSNLYVFYDTETKCTDEATRRGFILNKLYQIGFEPSTFNSDIALNKFYSLDTGRLKLRIEMAKNAIITLSIYDRSCDSTYSRKYFYTENFTDYILNKYLKTDDLREIKLNKILSNGLN